MSRLVTFRIAADPPPRLDRAIARDVPEAAHLSRSRLAKLIEAGAVTVNGAPARPKAKAAEGDHVEIAVPEAEAADIRAEAIPLHIVHEDDDLVVVDKPAGMVVHPAPGSPSGTLVNALMHRFGAGLSDVGGVARPGIVHRIDKDTSGLLVVARTDRAHHGLAAQFEAHSAERLYRAVCFGVPDPADPRLRGLHGVTWNGPWLRIATGLDRHPVDRQRQAVRREGGRRAVTHARVAEALEGAALLECRLETGRTHQIRVHMAHAGHGLVGDPVYGGRRRLGGARGEAAAAFPRQALHAATLGFRHPGTGEAMRFESPIPADMAALLDALR
ncbi:RluA family pseudouridine synthase [Jannaschia sp. W003]|uniref:RluA family pseudouridine synthase n=1 Tax=Jannaschia sp. W003 TaxID=2867012 RepID=UPI0021A7CE8C|nr:RluA family pseudouridine synthase [Jannaschia sp. W003]UWQ22693.1 RluA family pseudouridine synthase [Jannaschia sp. W003]